VALFTVDVENWNHGLHLENRGHTSDVKWLLNKLDAHKITAVLYLLGDWISENPDIYVLMKKSRHVLKTHGKHHYYDEKGDRSPYFNQEGVPGLCGGFFFRLLPLWLVKMEIYRVGMFFIHPHDLDENHPKLINPWFNWKRHINLKGAKVKLERLMKEVKWDVPSA